MEKILAKMPRKLIEAVNQLKEKYLIEINHGQVSFMLFGIRIYVENWAVEDTMRDLSDKYTSYRDSLFLMFDLANKYKDEELGNKIVHHMAQMFYLIVDQDKTDFKAVLSELYKITIDPKKMETFDINWLFDSVKIGDFSLLIGHILIKEMHNAIDKVKETGDSTPLKELDARGIIPYKLIIAESREEAEKIIEQELADGNVIEKVGRIMPDLQHIKTIGEA